MFPHVCHRCFLDSSAWDTEAPPPTNNTITRTAAAWFVCQVFIVASVFSFFFFFLLSLSRYQGVIITSRILILWPRAVMRAAERLEARGHRDWAAEISHKTPCAPVRLSLSHSFLDTSRRYKKNCLGLFCFSWLSWSLHLFFLALRCLQERHRWRTSRLKTAHQNMCWRDALLLTSIMILRSRCVFPSCRVCVCVCCVRLYILTVGLTHLQQEYWLSCSPGELPVD